MSLVPLRHSLLIASIILLDGCSKYQVGDALYSKEDGKPAGVITEIGTHDFGNGLVTKSFHIKRPDGTEAWGADQTISLTYEVRKGESGSGAGAKPPR